MRDLAYRRHQLSRARKRSLHYLRWLYSDRRWITTKAIARHAIDRAPCSCWMCRNPRHFLGEVTRQELRAVYQGDEQE